MQYLSPAFEEIWGFPREQAYTDLKELKDFIHPRDKSSVEATFKKQLSGEPTDIEFRVSAGHPHTCLSNQAWLQVQKGSHSAAAILPVSGAAFICASLGVPGPQGSPQTALRLWGGEPPLSAVEGYRICDAARRTIDDIKPDNRQETFLAVRRNGSTQSSVVIM